MAFMLLSLVLLQACSKPADNNSTTSDSTGSKEQITLNLSYWGSPNEVGAYKKAVANYEEKFPNVKVKLQHIPTDYDTKMTAMVAGNDEPDVAQMETGTIAFPLAEQGKFYNLQEFIDADDSFPLDKLVPYNTYSLEPGNIIGISPGPETFALFYNEDMFKEAGVEPPPSNVDDAWTWDEFVEVAQKMTLDTNGLNAADPNFDPKKIKQYGINLGVWWGVFSNFVYSNGGDFVSEDGQTFALNKPEAVEALQKLADLINVYHVAPSPIQAKNIPATNIALQTKKVAMAIDGQWATSNLASSKFNYNIGVLPVLKTPVTTVVSGTFSVFKSSKHPREAWELVKALVDPEAGIDMLIEGTWMPSFASWYKDESLLARWTKDLPSRPSGYQGAVIDMLLNHSHQTPTGYVKNFNKIMDIVNPALDKVWLGQQTAQEAMDGIAVKAQEQVKGRRDIK